MSQSMEHRYRRHQNLWRNVAVISAVLASPLLQSASAFADHPRFDLDQVRRLSQQLEVDTNRAVYEARRYSHPNDNLDRQALSDLTNLEYSARELREATTHNYADPYQIESAFQRVDIDSEESERTQRHLRGYNQVAHLLTTISRTVDSLRREINAPGYGDQWDWRVAQQLASEISRDADLVLRRAQGEIHPRDPYRAQKRRAIQDIRLLKQEATQLVRAIQQQPQDSRYSEPQLRQVRVAFAQARRSVGAAYFSAYVARELNTIAGDLAQLNRVYRDTTNPYDPIDRDHRDHDGIDIGFGVVIR